MTRLLAWFTAMCNVWAQTPYDSNIQEAISNPLENK